MWKAPQELWAFDQILKSGSSSSRAQEVKRFSHFPTFQNLSERASVEQTLHYNEVTAETSLVLRRFAKPTMPDQGILRGGLASSLCCDMRYFPGIGLRASCGQARGDYGFEASAGC